MWLVWALVMGINYDALWAELDPLGKAAGNHNPPVHKQRDFIKACLDPHKQYVSAICGIQSGKTLAGADATFAALYGPEPIMLPPNLRGRTPMEAWLVSKSYQLCDVQLETLKMRTPEDIWATDADLKRWGLKKGDQYTHWLLPRRNCEDRAPVKLRLRTSKDPESLRATPFLAWVWGDEATYWPEKSFLNLQGRAIVARTKFVFTTSPRGKDYVYRNLALPGGWPNGNGFDAKVASFGWSSADNPFADKEHLERLRRILGKEYAKQELDGLFTDQIGYVYGMFDRMVHMVKPPSEKPEDYDIIVGGIDPGMRDPYAVGVWGRHQGIWYQLWELHTHGQSSARLAPVLLMQQEIWKVKRWFVDKSAPSAIQDLRDAGLRAVPYIDIHGEDDRRTIPVMVAFCRELLRQGKLFISEDHQWTAEEFEKYHYPDESDTNPKNTKDIPVDWMNHHMDQMRYAICSVEEIPNVRPRYRQGADQRPREIGVRDPIKVEAYTMADAIRAQDEKFDQQASRERGNGRNVDNRWLRNRVRNRPV